MKQRPEQSDDQLKEVVRASGQFMGHGMTWALAVLFFMGLGFWADGKIGTGPILMVIGAFIGGGAGFYSLYFHIVIDPRQREEDPQ